MHKKQKSASLHFSKTTIYLGFLTLIIVSGFVSTFIIFRLEQRQQEQLGISTLRDMVTEANDNLRYPVPIDARSGDYYVADHRLLIPRDQSLVGLQYTSFKDFDDGSLLSFTSRNMISQAYANSRSANSLDELLASLPGLQACNRGISIHSKEIPDSSQVTLYKSKTLLDGRQIYIYSENACPTLADYLPAIEKIDSY